jgi:hypothetical protein
MNMNHHLVTLLFVFVSIGATAAEREYRSADEFAHTLTADPARKTKIVEIVEGDLNGDGLSDRAILTDEGDARSHRIYILLQTQRGRSSIAQETKQNDGFWEAVYLTIENGSLFINIEGMTPTSGARHQFKLYRGIWRMIGLKYSSVDAHRTREDGGVSTSGFDWNILTGDIIFEDDTDKEKNNKRDKQFVGMCRLGNYDFDPLFCARDCKMNKTQ